MKIYRVERYDGEGPFSNHFIGCMSTSLPEPTHDSGFPLGFIVNQDYIFGCKNKKLMKQWIRDAHELAFSGFVVNEYKIEKKKVINGKYQSLFMYDDATLAKKHCIISFKEG